MNDPVMKPNPRFGHPASRERPTKVAAALEKNNIAALVASGRDAARAKVHELIPKAPRSSPLPLGTSKRSAWRRNSMNRAGIMPLLDETIGF